MIRFKQSFGNVKCKVDAECMVSKYEISLLCNQPVNGLLTVQGEKNQEIIYVCDTKKTFAQVMQQGLNKESLLNALSQVAEVIYNVKRIGLDTGRIVLNPQWIYYADATGELQLMYCPVNGCNIHYDYILFFRDLMQAAKIDVDTRKMITGWLAELQKSGMTQQNVSRIRTLADMRRSNVINTVDEEAPTGMDEEENCFDEVSTGMDVNNDYGQVGDDGEAPTGLEEDDEEGRTVGEEDYLYASMGRNDGTFQETTSESGYYSVRPFLYRVSTGEKVTISKDEFKIGRSMQRADYCITNNNSVSNIHATIFTKNGTDYYLKDNRSTNGTIVDGKKVDANGMAAMLKDGSRICLFNEELEFRF